MRGTKTGVLTDDLLSAHRMPPQMMGIIPDNAGGFGDVEKAAQVFVRNELTPLQERMKELEYFISENIIRFKIYSLNTNDSTILQSCYCGENSPL
ncbi:capsid portal protein [Rahnella aquatilis HX2]|nr:capsid portal protein [Rahnella aquatilis HX2]